jgi:hypothetical protein
VISQAHHLAGYLTVNDTVLLVSPFGKIETTKNIYGHLFAQDRAFILEAMNQAVSRLYVEDDSAEQAA